VCFEQVHTSSTTSPGKPPPLPRYALFSIHLRAQIQRSRVSSSLGNFVGLQPGPVSCALRIERTQVQRPARLRTCRFMGTFSWLPRLIILPVVLYLWCLTIFSFKLIRNIFLALQITPTTRQTPTRRPSAQPRLLSLPTRTCSSTTPAGAHAPGVSFSTRAALQQQGGSTKRQPMQASSTTPLQFISEEAQATAATFLRRTSFPSPRNSSNVTFSHLPAPKVIANDHHMVCSTDSTRK